MNITYTSPDSMASLPLQRAQFFIAMKKTYLHAPTPLNRRGISGDLTDFSSTNGALCAVKRTQEGNESQIYLTRQCVKSSVTTSKVHHRIQLTCKRPRRWTEIEVTFQVT